MKFLDLVTHIAEVDDVARLSAGRLVQQALSLRNQEKIAPPTASGCSYDSPMP
jgi:hypothetical protein